MLLQETRTIDGLEFTTSKLPARKAFALQNRILKLIMPIIGAINAEAAAGSMADMDLGALASALQKLFESLSDNEAEKLLLEVLGSTSVQLDEPKLVITLNKADQIDLAFTGRLMTMYRACAFALEWNFSDFIDAAKGAVAKLQAASKAKATTKEKASA